jgi:hypothetical protein
MMELRRFRQDALFCEFSLERHVPVDRQLVKPDNPLSFEPAKLKINKSQFASDAQRQLISR